MRNVGKFENTRREISSPPVGIGNIFQISASFLFSILRKIDFIDIAKILCLLPFQVFKAAVQGENDLFDEEIFYNFWKEEILSNSGGMCPEEFEALARHDWLV